MWAAGVTGTCNMIDLSFLDDPPLAREAERRPPSGARHGDAARLAVPTVPPGPVAQTDVGGGGAEGPLTAPTRDWCREALVLLEAAEALVEKLGVSGRHPDVKDAAAVVTSAYNSGDLETVRFACSEFVATVRLVATL